MNLEDVSNDSIEDKAKCIGYNLSLWPITECGYKDNKRKHIILRLALHYNDVGAPVKGRAEDKRYPITRKSLLSTLVVPTYYLNIAGRNTSAKNNSLGESREESQKGGL